MVKPPTYEWRCPSCDSVNPAHAGVCAKCQHDVTYRRPTLWRELRDAGIPLWRCVAAFVFGCTVIPLLFVGIFFFARVFFPLNTMGMLWTAAATLFGGALTWGAHKLLESTSS